MGNQILRQPDGLYAVFSTETDTIVMWDATADEFDAQTLEDAARWELELLWGDLHRARRYAINGEWSMDCDHLVARIRMFTRLVGPTPWEKIQIPLLEDGVYQRIHADMGVAAEVDMARVAETRRSIDERTSRLRR